MHQDPVREHELGHIGVSPVAADDLGDLQELLEPLERLLEPIRPPIGHNHGTFAFLGILALSLGRGRPHVRVPFGRVLEGTEVGGFDADFVVGRPEMALAE